MKPMSSGPILRPKTRTKQQKVHATNQLALGDAAIAVDAKILQSVLDEARRTIKLASARRELKFHPTLYCKYRGIGFPLRTKRNRKLPQWRSLSPWMKTQLASLCLGEAPLLQIRLHIHDELRAKREAGGKDIRVYLRDRLTRTLNMNFDPAPWFFIAIEDRDVTGEIEVRPHVHGSIALPRLPVPTKIDGSPKARFRRIIDAEPGEKGLAAAEYLAGRIRLHRALKIATGNDGLRPAVVGTVNQSHNVWKREPYNPLFNDHWVSYTLKNQDAASLSLSDQRLSISQPLRREAQRLWELIRTGEAAIHHWD